MQTFRQHFFEYWVPGAKQQQEQQQQLAEDGKAKADNEANEGKEDYLRPFLRRVRPDVDWSSFSMSSADTASEADAKHKAESVLTSSRCAEVR